ncbi:MAG: GNAT family N-acetyltransferase [Firmicutes bacterium]|nr:GNAT family N-acetyltransferase [Bacillota bacterium]
MKIVHSLSKRHKKFLNAGLSSFNRNAYGEFAQNEGKNFGFYCFDDKAFAGGIYGTIDDGDWVYIDLLFVDEKYRGKDIAIELMKKAEQWAIENKCTGVRTTTWDFQAKGFYEKCGYSVYGVLEDHPRGASDYYLKKKL